MSHALENKLYSGHYKVVNVVDYGIDFGKFTGGEIPPPASGARFDICFDGKCEGKIQGTVKGADYLYVRGDGRMELNVRQHRGRRPAVSCVAHPDEDAVGQ